MERGVSAGACGHILRLLPKNWKVTMSSQSGWEPCYYHQPPRLQLGTKLSDLCPEPFHLHSSGGWARRSPFCQHPVPHDWAPISATDYSTGPEYPMRTLPTQCTRIQEAGIASGNEVKTPRSPEPGTERFCDIRFCGAQNICNSGEGFFCLI